MVAKQLAVLGSPISGSKSPAIHAAAYKELGLDWQYERHQVDAEGFKAFIESNPQLYGLSLTMPLKTQAYEYALSRDAKLDAISVALHSVNTLVNFGDRLEAFNTDVYGVTEALRSAEVPQPSTLAILGSGATSRSVLMGVLDYFDSVDRISVFSRNADAAAETLALAQSLSPQAEIQWLPLEAAADFGGADLTCNTLPGDIAADIEVDVPFGGGWLFDVSYNPWPSQLALAWPESNRISGFEMLLNQALAQVRIFVHGDPSATLDNEGHVFAAMRAACQ